jgi:aerobic-type carbon monoxide dehydrogenase small subunit (CoxS/CutS family)
VSNHSLRFALNGKPVKLEVEARQSLAEAIRDGVGLTGTHLGCEHGACGACTVLLDGHAVRGCLIFAVQVEGASVTTIEGISPAQGLDALQESFRQHHALQCGFCTPGMVLALHELLLRNPVASLDEIRDAISGNLCRCTGYQPIVAAAHDIARANERRLGDPQGQH